MKIRKLIKILSGTILISIVPLSLSAVFTNKSRNIKKYDNLFNDLWDKLGITERSDKKIKIGIIDSGLVDYRMLKFNGKTAIKFDNDFNEDNYSIIDSYNNKSINFGKIIYNPSLNDSSVYKKNELSWKNTFTEYWEENEHATQIASIIAGDAGLLKNAEIYSTSYNRTYPTTSLNILKENLEFFRKNIVKFINMSFSSYYNDFYDLDKIKEDFEKNNFDKIKYKINTLKSLIYTDYPDIASLIDEYAYKYNMKFFISSGNRRTKVLEMVNQTRKWISDELNKDGVGKIKRLFLKALLNVLDPKLDFWKKTSPYQRTKNTFIVGAYDIKNDEIENFSNGKINKFDDSPLGVAPDNFSDKSLLLIDEPYSTETDLDDPDPERWLGTSFSTPVLLAMSALLESIKRPDSSFDVPELKAILAASFSIKKYKKDIFNLPDNIGFSYADWNRMKFYADNVVKFRISDLLNDSSGFDYTRYITGSDKYLLVLSNYSDLFKLSNSERKEISKEEIDNHVNLFNTNLHGSIFATPEWIYKQYHVSSMNFNYDNVLGNTSASTNRFGLYDDKNYNGLPYEYTVYIKLKDSFKNWDLSSKYAYSILSDVTATNETRYKLGV
ncbi:subtilase family protein [Mycoplasmopsis mustelae]|uniref:Subtilase family protein n=1 Tax=Mycoplasmopsis mustelae TaxID=171289 RepID=A0A4R7UEZ8_9BACT|nr:S8 family serine peptidase [Mycoplasmopsis mustelae]TDV24224.1 subtilase family protein [Mycoplasmopsis mustelae]